MVPWRCTVWAFIWSCKLISIYASILINNTQQRPFRAKTNEELQKSILNDAIEFPKDPKVSPDAVDFIRALLTRDITKRIGVGEAGFKRLKKHAWLKDMCWDILSSKAIGAPFIPDVCCIFCVINNSLFISSLSFSLSLSFAGKKIKLWSNARAGGGPVRR